MTWPAAVASADSPSNDVPAGRPPTEIDMANSAVQQHHQKAPETVDCAVVTVSDTRSLGDDRGGDLIVALLTSAGHAVTARTLVPDDKPSIEQAVADYAKQADVEAILLTGGTGISARDVTPDVVEGMLDRTLPGFGELFRTLSYQEIGPSAMLSRALGGVIGRSIVLLMPGSPAAIRLAMQQLVLPELRHLVQQAQA